MTHRLLPSTIKLMRIPQMGVRNQEKEILDRLEQKTLDGQFASRIQNGLSCSPFEAQAVLNVVLDIYGPSLGRSDCAPTGPGQVRLVAVDADEPAGKPISQCEKRTVTLTVHRGSIDDKLLKQGARTFRQARIIDLCQDALSQGALLTREDLAFRIFFVALGTISRDLQTLRKKTPTQPIPMRSTIHDMGPVLTHRVEIVRLALTGKTTTQICSTMHHSPGAVNNYLSVFMRVAQLKTKGMSISEIAFLLRKGQGLIKKYIDLLAECEKEKNYAYHLKELLQRGKGLEKKSHRDQTGGNSDEKN
jgi:Protein of unknown function (DUF1670)